MVPEFEAAHSLIVASAQQRAGAQPPFVVRRASTSPLLRIAPFAPNGRDHGQRALSPIRGTGGRRRLSLNDRRR